MADLKKKLPQEGTSCRGESLPETTSAVSGCPSYSGGGTIPLINTQTKEDDGAKDIPLAKSESPNHSDHTLTVSYDQSLRQAGLNWSNPVVVTGLTRREYISSGSTPGVLSRPPRLYVTEEERKKAKQARYKERRRQKRLEASATGLTSNSNTPILDKGLSSGQTEKKEQQLVRVTPAPAAPEVKSGQSSGPSRGKPNTTGHTNTSAAPSQRRGHAASGAGRTSVFTPGSGKPGTQRASSGGKGASAGKAPEKGKDKAKRVRPDETISPKVSNKKPKLDQSTGTKPGSYAAAAALHNTTYTQIAVTSDRRRYISSEQSDDIAKFIMGRILDLTRRKVKDFPEPSFSGKPSYDGQSLRLTVKTTECIDWLREELKAYPAPEGDSVVVLRPEELPERIRCGIVLPGTDLVRDNIGKVLHVCNGWAQVPRWLMFGLHVQRHVDSTYAEFSVPEDVAREIIRRRRELTYMLGSVYVKFWGAAEEKYVARPPAHLVSAPRNLADEPTTSTPSNKMDVEASTSSQPTTAAEKDEEEVLLGFDELILDGEESQDGQLLDC